MLFNTEMVRALLDNRKSVTRRDPFQLPEEFSSMKLKGMEYRHKNTYKSEAYKWKNEKILTAVFENDGDTNYIVPCRYKPGDILYVRETWNGLPANEIAGISATYWYKADEPNDADTGVLRERWHPSIHMPREAARIFLRVTDVRVERLQDMRLADFLAEGVQLLTWEADDRIRAPLKARERYSGVWDSTLKPADRSVYGWDANPWVRVVEFERTSREDE